MLAIEVFRNENDPYIDFEFFLDNHYGVDWKAFVFFDTDDGQWSKPEYSISPHDNKNHPFEETDK